MNPESGANDSCAAALSEAAAWEVLRTIDDPEMPISIVDLGIVLAVRVQGPGVEVDILPTFIGCPALDMIRDRVEQRLRAGGAGRVNVRFLHDPAWSVDRISAAGRESLRQHGVSVPDRDSDAAPLVPLYISGVAHASRADAVACPHCGAAGAELESAFGPTRCRSIYYCSACRNSFERLRRV